MKRIALFVTLLAVIGCGTREQKPHGDHGKQHKDAHGDHGKEGQAVLMVQSEPKSVEATKPAILKLMIHDAKGAMVRDFDIIHEEKVHLIIVRSGLDQFAHVHPEVDGSGNLTVKHAFPVGGTYFLFADYQPKGQTQATARAELKVSGESPPAPPLKPNAPGKVEADGLTAEISIKGGKGGAESSIRFDLRDEKGKPVFDLQPYMGELGHLVILSADGKEYVHTHAEKGKADQGVLFMAHFPSAGLFKGWGQFRRQDQIRVIPFVLKID